MNFFKFVQEKSRNIKPGALFFLEFEGFVVWICGSIPGLIGFALRNLAYRMLFKKGTGFFWIQPRVMFVHSNKLSVGRLFAVNSGTYINAIGTVTIGDYVMIGNNVTISSGRHPIEGVEPPVAVRPTIPMPIVIEDDVWIGAGAVILPGVTLRKGTVVAANSLVTRNTKNYSVVAGIPAERIFSRGSYVQTTD